jgi:serine/threonine protein kinase
MQLLGARGFDAVYLVRDLQAEQQVYVLKERFEPNKRVRDRFIFECIVRKQLHHPALPHIYRVFEDDEQRAYMLVQYIGGSNLETLRQQRPDKCYTLLAILSVLAPVKDAVAYLHRQQPAIVHRAIKPANILLPERNKVVLVNYGFDKAPPDGTFFPLFMCSSGYSAPEQYYGESTPRTDIYGLGATVYTLLTGIAPPDAYTRTSQLLAQGVDPLMRANQLTQTIPVSIASVLQQALAIESENRFATVDEFWQTLNSASVQLFDFDVPPTTSSSLLACPKGSDTVPALPVTPRPSSSPMQGRKWAALLLAILMLVVVIGVTLGVWASVLITHRPGSVAPPTPGHVQTAILSSPTAMITSVVVSVYTGTIYDVAANMTTTIVLTNVQQNFGRVSGFLSMGGRLRGSGPFKGVISATKHLQFTVSDAAGRATLSFEGTIGPDGNLAGSYCQLDASGRCGGDYGVWSVAPTPF